LVSSLLTKMVLP